MGVLRGLGAYGEALPLIRRLGLVSYVWRTAAVSVAIFIVIVPACVGLAVVVARPLRQYALAALPPLLSDLAVVALILAFLALGYLLYKHIILVVVSPWMSEVAGRVQDHLRREEAAFAEPVSPSSIDRSSFARSVRLNLRLAAREILLSLPLLLMGLIPGVNLVSALLLLLVQSYFAGAGVLDTSLERTHDYRSSLAYLKQHRGMAIGVGAGFVALMLTVIGVVLIPVWCAAAGAVAVHRQETRARS